MKTKALITILILVLGSIFTIQAQEVVRFSSNTVETERTSIVGYLGGSSHTAMFSETITIKFGLRIDGTTLPIPLTYANLPVPDYREAYMPYTYTAYGQTVYKTVTIPAGQYNYFSFSFNTPTWPSGYVNARLWIEEIVSGNAVIGYPSMISIIHQK